MPKAKIKSLKISRRSVLHITVLAAIFGISIWGFLRFRGFEALQLYVVSAAVFAYIGWGALFHYYHRRLNWGMVLEYFLIGALVLLLFFWLLLFS